MWKWRSRRENQRIREIHAPAAESIQELEDRALLAGNVLASLSGPHFAASGDNADNQLELALIDNNIVLRGLTNTTINGSSDPFIIASNTNVALGNIIIGLYGGNDSLVISRNATFAGTVWIDGGTGNDEISVTGATFRSQLNIYGRAGDDTISVQDATTEGLLRIKGKSGNDLISLTDVDAKGEIRIEGGGGNDGVSFKNVTTAALTKMNTGTGNDDVVISGSTLNGTLRLRGKRGSDMLTMDGNTVNGPVAINMGSGDDGVQLRNANNFNSWFHVQAGQGNADAVDLGTNTVFNGGSRVRKSEGSTVNPTLTNRIDAATTGLIARAAAADMNGSDLLNLTLTLDTSDNTTESSVGGVLITRNSNFILKGTTLPGAIVTLDTDGDGNFDNGTLTADNQGNFSTTVTLVRSDFDTSTAVDDQLNGLNKIAVRATVDGIGTRDASVNVEFIPSTDQIVRFTTNEGTYEVEMFNSLTPNTVANFMSYESRYTNAIVQRLVTNFVIQAGGYTVANNKVSAITKDAAIANEYNSLTSNIRGTLSMATPGNNINGGSSEWFVNTVNNSANLDSVPHTVFGRVIGNGMTVVDKIAALTPTDLSAATGIGDSTNGPLNTVPMRVPFNPLTKTLTGTVSMTANSTTITGVGTKFLTELHGDLLGTGSRILVNGVTLRVAAINSDTSLTVLSAPTTSSSGQSFKTDDFADDNFVRFSSISEILSV